MPQFYLTPADMQTRQRIDSGDGSTPVEVYLGGTADAFIAGDFVDIVRVGTVPVTVLPYNGATINALVSDTLYAVGDYIRATFDDDTETWDLDYYAAGDQVFAFQVGIPQPLGDHAHYVPMYAKQAAYLVNETDKTVAVGDPSQPSVVLPSNQSGSGPHTHDLTVYFDYVNSTFIVTEISNNGLDNHEAALIGTAGAGAIAVNYTEIPFGNVSNDGLDSTPEFTYDANTGALNLNNSLFVVNPADVNIRASSVEFGGGYDGAEVNITGGIGDDANDNAGGGITLQGGGLHTALSRMAPWLYVGGTVPEANYGASIEMRAGYVQDGSVYSGRPFCGDILIGGGYTSSSNLHVSGPQFNDIKLEAHFSDHPNPAVNSGITLETSGTQRLRIGGTGAFFVNSSAGNIGDVLVSAGAAAPPAWGPMSVSTLRGTGTLAQALTTAASGVYVSMFNTNQGTDTPTVTFRNNLAALDKKVVEQFVDSNGTFRLQFSNDAYTQQSQPLTITRTGSFTAALITLTSNNGINLVPGVGSLQIGGNAGTSGQQLTSAGPSAPPVWAAPAKPAPLTIVTITASQSLGSALHHNQHLRSTSGTDITLTVQSDSFYSGTDTYYANGGNPANPSTMPIGGVILVGKHGAGNVIFAPGAGVTINSPDSLTIDRLHGKATLIKVAANVWDIEGNLASV